MWPIADTRILKAETLSEWCQICGLDTICSEAAKVEGNQSIQQKIEYFRHDENVVKQTTGIIAMKGEGFIGILLTLQISHAREMSTAAFYEGTKTGDSDTT